MELLERVVRKDRCTRALGYLQNECIASPDSSGGRRQQLAIEHGLLVLVPLGGINSMCKSCVNNYYEVVEVVFLHEVSNSFIELGERRNRPSFSSDV